MSNPTYLSGEVGNVDATTLVVTFDQAVTLVEADPDDVAMGIGDPVRGGYAVPNPGWAGRGRGAGARG